MRNRRIERTALAPVSLAACAVLLGTFAAVGQAEARSGGGHAAGAMRGLSGPPPFLDSVPATPAPAFNPSEPYTLPQSPETPVSPGSPGSVFGPGPGAGTK
jgi:hypothetical protein